MSKANKAVKADNALEVEITGVEDFGALIGAMPNPDVILRKAGVVNDVYDEMIADTHIFSAYQKRKRKVLKLRHKIETEDKAIEDFLVDVFSKINTNYLINGLYKGVAYGYAVSELIWGYDENGKFIIQDIKNRSPHKFSFTENGELLYKSKEGEKLAPYGKFILFRNDLDDEGNPYGNALLSKCYWYWRFKKFGWKMWGLFLEKYGDPALILQTDEPDETKQKNKLDTLDSVRGGSNLVIGKDETLGTIKVPTGSNIGYENYIKKADDEISKTFLSSTMLLDETAHGTYNVANQHGSDLDDIILSDAHALSRAVTEYIINPLLVFNFGAEYEGKADFVMYDEKVESQASIDDEDDNSNNSDNNEEGETKNSIELYSSLKDLP